MKKESVIIFVTILLAFLGILFFTSTLGEFFGKKAEMAALTAVAVFLAVVLVLNNRSGDE